MSSGDAVRNKVKSNEVNNAAAVIILHYIAVYSVIDWLANKADKERQFA